MSEDAVFTRQFDYADRIKLTDSAYEELKAAIVDLRLPPGTMLRESSIGRQLGVSKTPVREALLKLEQDGLVELVPFKGGRVVGYSRRDVREIFELRALLEGACARRAAEHGDAGLLEKLEANVADSTKAMKRKDVEAIIALFDEFDDLIFTQMDNGRVQTLIANLQIHMRRIGKPTTQIPGRIGSSIEQHEAILATLAGGDPDGAEQAMRAHIESVLQDEIAHMPGDQELTAVPDD